jgi:hypothetical protein
MLHWLLDPENILKLCTFFCLYLVFRAVHRLGEILGDFHSDFRKVHYLDEREEAEDSADSH